MPTKKQRPSLACLRWLASALALSLPLTPAIAAASNMYEVFNGSGPYPIETPPTPPAGGGGDLFYRWVPLCEDGSGDHEWSTSGKGLPPTCRPTKYIRCIDGTRPMYYVDRAKSYDGNEEIHSDNWVFWFQGGGSCSDGNGNLAGENCWHIYQNLNSTKRDQMGTSTRPESIQGLGILDPNRQENEFKTYNRVRIWKCGYDRFTGHSSLWNTSNLAGDTFHLYWHGRRSIKAVLADLEAGVSFDDENGPNTLPPLSEADRVLFTGHSGGAGGLIFNIDWMAEQIHAMRPAAKVGALIDARFKPGISTEAHFDTSTYSLPGDDTNGDGLIGPYDHKVPTVANPGDIGAAGLSDYHRGTFDLGGDIHGQQTQWSVNLDESCEAHHGVGAMPCRDEINVLLNHVETPFFVRQALQDSSHINNRVLWAVDPAFRWTVNFFKARVLFQLERLYLGHHTQSVLGLSANPPTWPHGAFVTNTSTHVGNHNDTQFFDVELCEIATGTRYSYHDALFEWFTYDTEVMAIADPNAVAGPWCNPSHPACTAC